MPKHVGALLTYLLHGAESFLRSWPVFAASQEIPCIFMEPESSLPYSQVPATCPYPEPTPSSPHDSLQVSEDPLLFTFHTSFLSAAPYSRVQYSYLYVQ